MTPLTVVLGSPPWEFRRVAPLYPAFARMVRDLEFDVSEMALVTFLQAREAGVPITLLPLVTVGGTHHRSLTRRPEAGPLGPGDLRGKRVGVRSYSQTTGMWVRGILREEYGIEASDITWVTTEEPHVAQYREPDFVQRSTAATVGELLRAGEVDAAVLGPKAVGGQGAGLVPDADAAADAWVARHGTVPVNHMVVVRDDVLRRDPASVHALYLGLRATASAEWIVSLEIAARYAFEQQLVRTPVDVGAIVEEATGIEREATGR
jgi:4,5-dihydroxyphthalate decarboxylase